MRVEESVAGPPTGGSVVDRFLRLFSDVRAGEGGTVLLLTLNLFILMVGYYVFKVVREPLVLALPSGAEMKSYAAAAQALTLMGFVPLYSWFSSRVDRMWLIRGVIAFFLICIEAFYLGFRAGVPMLGFFFYVFVGIFSLATIAQFWSYANDLYSRPTGERLFPIIAIGATAGSPLGAIITEPLFKAGYRPYNLFQITAALLFVHLGLFRWIDSREGGRRSQAAKARERLTPTNGFALLFRNRYLLILAALLLVLNIVNTTGEYLVGRTVVETAKTAASPEAKEAILGAFYGGYYFWTNVIAFGLQAFVASRLVKYLGIGGVVMALPLVAMGSYSVVAAGVGLAVLRWCKIAENATDYSIMNTARQMLWLPTSREEKYKAKQAADTFVVRSGDMLSAVAVFFGARVLGVRGFAVLNLVLVAVWLTLAVALVRRYGALAKPSE